MKELIEALQIIWKYMTNPDTNYPTSCEHDMLYVGTVDFNKVDGTTVRKLAELGFIPGLDDEFRTIERILGHDFAITGDYTKITDEQWESVKGELYGVFRSYKFGSY